MMHSNDNLKSRYEPTIYQNQLALIASMVIGFRRRLEDMPDHEFRAEHEALINEVATFPLPDNAGPFLLELYEQEAAKRPRRNQVVIATDTASPF